LESRERRFEKGFFSRVRLPVAERYVYPTGRGLLFSIGAVGALVVGAIFLADAFLGRASMVAQGPLSASHALFGGDCALCHTPMQGVADASCQSCHRQVQGGLEVYGFERHYLYRSGDVDRSAPASMEISCAGCHREHRGREESLRRVADAQCISCHTAGTFGDGHPEFEFARRDRLEPANLRFPHTLHVREVMDELGLVEAEAACLQCHAPRPDGRSFEPISFARSCDQCHLSPSASTPLLPLATAAGAGPGVETLAQIRNRGAPGDLWAAYWNPNEFRQLGDQIQKRPVYHEDPWILHNLRLLRRQLYPGAELADLLRTTPDVPPREVRALYQEAVETLRQQIQALRGDPSPEVQGELAGLNSLLTQIERRLEQPFTLLDETRFDVRVADRAPALATGELDEGAFRDVMDDLTQPCQTCHMVDRGTIRRVQADQRSLVRAEFDHRAHVIHARCLDCHSRIPIREALLTGQDPPEELDRAEIQNLPTIETCLSCHTSRAAPASCTTCHMFHPDKSHWANLSR